MSALLDKIWQRVKGVPYRKRLLVISIAVIIGSLSLLFTTRMSRMLQLKEMNEMALWSYAMERMGESTHNDPIIFQVVHNQNIPFVLLDENGRVEKSHLVPEHILNHPERRMKLIMKLSRQNDPIEISTPRGSRYILFYGNSALLDWLILFPYVQLAVVAIFVFFAFLTFRTSKQDEQNRVWIGLAKETAHQLGTPISSLMGWLEYLRSQGIDPAAVEEMSKDLKRLVKVADRFGKIGSETSLNTTNLGEVVGDCVLYFRTRIPRKVTLNYNGLAIAPVMVQMNAALFEWVVENLLKNALDALQGVGTIDVVVSQDDEWAYIDVRDTGKGIAKSNWKKIFEPGFTTKTRGWGLGLSLSKRIIEEYHKGHIAVTESEMGKGTNIRISVRKS
ncbi:MAG: HAMP domain-containing histidine kinase [Tidjanibacter sp.]|nr:HAMP domain-containing histidine kinase [Tidjanibacter sp.]